MTPTEELQEFGITLAGYKNFISKRLSSFKLNTSARDEYLDTAGVFQEDEAFLATAYIALTVIKASKRILNTTGVFLLMLPEDQMQLQNSIYFQTTFFAINDTTFEKITGTSVNTPNWNFNQDTSRNIIQNDVLGTYAKIAIKNSEIDKYKLFSETKEYLEYKRTSRGEFYLAGETGSS